MKKQRKNNYLTDKIARVGSRRRAILSDKKKILNQANALSKFIQKLS